MAPTECIEPAATVVADQLAPSSLPLGDAIVTPPVPLDAGRFYATTPKFVRPLAAMNELYSMCRYWFGVNLVSISESSLLSIVRSASKAESVFGPQDEVERAVRMFVQGANSQPLSFFGRFAIKSTLQQMLKARATAMEYVLKNPSICEQEIRKPIIVLGFPRTGTTMLYNLLALDPATRAPRLWEMSHLTNALPLASKEDVLKSKDPRIEAGVKAMQTLEQVAPGLVAEMGSSHPIQVNGPEEELLVLMQQMLLLVYAPAGGAEFQHWLFDEHNKDSSYLYMKRYVQMLQSSWAPDSHWTLKSPIHALYLRSLLQQFPDARIVTTHRPLEAVLPSFCRLLETHNSCFFEKDGLSRLDLGGLAIRLADAMTSRMIRFREAHENKDQFCDVQYNALTKDPIAVVRSIYRHYGMTVSAEHLRRMKSYVAANPQGKHGRAEYRLGDYGLDHTWVRDRYAEYYHTYLEPSQRA